MPVEWKNVNKVLLIRLRSIGDTVLSTPSLIALRRFLPDAQIDILLEDWVAPLLDNLEEVNNVIPVGKSFLKRLAAAQQIRSARYDVVFNLHGGTTGTFFAAASGARHRIGFSHYQYRFLYSDAFPSGEDFWNNPRIHSVEQQLALLGSAGVPVDPKPSTKLAIVEAKKRQVIERLREAGLAGSEFVLMHPAAAFSTKQWSTENFAAVAEALRTRGLSTVAVAGKGERKVLDALVQCSSVPVAAFDDLKLPEITALASMARLFVGNDSGIAHIAAAVDTPCVVIFGSSNRDNWHPWTSGPYETVFKEFVCQPCAGYRCEEFGKPRCILEVHPDAVLRAIERVFLEIEKRRAVPPAVV